MADLTPTKRSGQVISVLMTPTPTVEIQVGGDTTVSHFAPFVDSYAPNVGDYVELLENQGAYVVLGSKGSSLAVVDATGPGTQTDYTNPGATVVSVTVPVINGRKYRVGGYIFGTQVTVSGGTAVKIFAGGADIGPSVRLVSRTLAISEQGIGYAAWRYLATSTASVAFSLFASTTAGAFRVSANAAQITVEDNGF